MFSLRLLGVSTLLSMAFAGDVPPYPLRLAEEYFPAFVDNFDLGNGNSTLGLRLLVDGSPPSEDEGPLVVYTGNEAAIEYFANRCGQVYLLADHLGGRAAFIEQRFYGESFPDPRPTDFKFLSTEQVLADFAGAITYLRNKFGSPSVVAVGGSYGGMLAAWLQRQHPALIDAAWASSAPVLGFADTLVALDRQSQIYAIIERDYPCAATIGDAFRDLLLQPAAEVEAELGLCPAPAGSDIIVNAVGWLQGALGALGYSDYPYPAGTLPANPTMEACRQLETATAAASGTNSSLSGAQRLMAAVGWYVNPTATNTNSNASECRALDSFYSYYLGLTPGPWTYQRCYDLIMAYEVDESSKMFLPCSIFSPNCWSEDLFASFCQDKFGARPRPSSSRAAYFASGFWNDTMSLQQRVILTNGRLDPWSYGGVGYPGKQQDDETAAGRNVIWLSGAAHHLDIFWPNPLDPPSVVAAREYIFQLISDWLTPSKDGDDGNKNNNDGTVLSSSPAPSQSLPAQATSASVCCREDSTFGVCFSCGMQLAFHYMLAGNFF